MLAKCKQNAVTTVCRTHLLLAICHNVVFLRIFCGKHLEFRIFIRTFAAVTIRGRECVWQWTLFYDLKPLTHDKKDSSIRYGGPPLRSPRLLTDHRLKKRTDAARDVPGVVVAHSVVNDRQREPRPGRRRHIHPLDKRQPDRHCGQPVHIRQACRQRRRPHHLRAGQRRLHRRAGKGQHRHAGPQGRQRHPLLRKVQRRLHA